MTRFTPIGIVVIDDDEQHLGFVAAALTNENVRVYTAESGATGWKMFQEKRPQAVLLDLKLPDMNGMDLLARIADADPGVEVVLMTGHYSTESAVEAIHKGASDYLNKPLDLQKLRQRVNDLVANRQKRRHAEWLDQGVVETFTFEGIVGRSPLMLEVFSRIRRIAPHFQTALVTGPTGSGKELVARALHRLGRDASKPMVVCNCSAITETLIESELFGYVRGAFTGATSDKVGLFEYAAGGTLFLDEIGELSLSAQAKLLRVLQQKEIQRVGSPEVRKVDVRVIAATNRDLRKMVEEKTFREDLFYRVSMVEIRLPKLHERKEDLILLQRHFLQSFNAQMHRQIRGLTLRAQQRLARYDWPGNVRELENAIGQAYILTDSDVIDVDDLPEYLRRSSGGSEREEEMMSLKALQRLHVSRVLKRVAGNKAQAAEILGISRSTLYELLREEIS
jgi:two-component system response regulator HydG